MLALTRPTDRVDDFMLALTRPIDRADDFMLAPSTDRSRRRLHARADSTDRSHRRLRARADSTDRSHRRRHARTHSTDRSRSLHARADDLTREVEHSRADSNQRCLRRTRPLRALPHEARRSGTIERSARQVRGEVGQRAAETHHPTTSTIVPAPDHRGLRRPGPRPPSALEARRSGTIEGSARQVRGEVGQRATETHHTTASTMILAPHHRGSRPTRPRPPSAHEACATSWTQAGAGGNRRRVRARGVGDGGGEPEGLGASLSSHAMAETKHVHRWSKRHA